MSSLTTWNLFADCRLSIFLQMDAITTLFLYQIINVSVQSLELKSRLRRSLLVNKSEYFEALHNGYDM